MVAPIIRVPIKRRALYSSFELCLSVLLSFSTFEFHFLRSKRRYEAEKVKAAALLETKAREAKKESEGIRALRDRPEEANEGHAEE